MNSYNIITLILKASISIMYLFLVIKISGKKQISELNIFDYVVGMSLGNIAAEMTVNKEISITIGIVSMSVYGIISLFISFITNKSIIARRLISGYPIVLMENGKISKKNLSKVKLDLNDLMQDAREAGYFNLSEINNAVMEISGKVSFLPKSRYKPVINNDLKIKTSNEGLTANLIIDGKIMYNNLKNIKRDEKWLMKKLAKEGYYNIEDVLLVLCDGKENLTIYKNNVEFNNSVLE